MVDKTKRRRYSQFKVPVGCICEIFGGQAVLTKKERVSLKNTKKWKCFAFTGYFLLFLLFFEVVRCNIYEQIILTTYFGRFKGRFFKKIA